MLGQPYLVLIDNDDLERGAGQSRE
jgi:hypothetical protein